MGQFAAARRLTEAGADPAFTDNQGNTLLHLACNHGRIDIVKWLLQLGVDPQAKNQQEETPATWAARAGFEKLAAMLGWVNNDPKDSGVAQAGQALCDCSYGSCLPIELR
jgi:ankyrin repeat protein